jgi:hypothetical protein
LQQAAKSLSPSLYKKKPFHLYVWAALKDVRRYLIGRYSNKYIFMWVREPVA